MGRPAKLTEDELRWTAQTVRDETPQRLKFPYALWTRSLIRELIHRHLGKALSKGAVRRVMKILGFTPQKPLYRAWQQDSGLARQLEAETFPQIQAEARRGTADRRLDSCVVGRVLGESPPVGGASRR